MAEYAAPTSANLTSAVADMQLAFIDAAGRAPDHTELGAGSIGGMTLTPGVYKWDTGTDVWIFQIAQDLMMSGASIKGSLLAQTAINIDSSTVSAP